MCVDKINPIKKSNLDIFVEQSIIKTINNEFKIDIGNLIGYITLKYIGNFSIDNIKRRNKIVPIPWYSMSIQTFSN